MVENDCTNGKCGLTVDEEISRVKLENRTKGIKVCLTMKDVPLSLMKEFCSDIKDYNDIYWVKLRDLMRKAEMYDYLIMSQNGAGIGLDEEYIEPKEDNNEEVKLLGRGN